MVADLSRAQFLEKLLACFSGGKCCKHLAANLADFCEPRAGVVVELFFNLYAQRLRQCRAFSGGRYGNLQRTAPHHGGEEEVTIWRIVHGVAKNAALLCVDKNRMIDLAARSSGDDQKDVLKIAGLKFAFDQANASICGQAEDFSAHTRSYHGNLRAALQQAVDLGLSNRTRAYDEAAAAFELEEHGK